jgi:hypothetical protein
MLYEVVPPPDSVITERLTPIGPARPPLSPWEEHLARERDIAACMRLRASRDQPARSVRPRMLRADEVPLFCERERGLLGLTERWPR